MSMWEVVLITCGVALLATGVVWARWNEKRQWNHGTCSECGHPWEGFDIDSQGGRGYKDASGHTIWISYAVDR